MNKDKMVKESISRKSESKSVVTVNKDKSVPVSKPQVKTNKIVKTKGKGKSINLKKDRVSARVRAGLQFPCSRIARYLRKGQYCPRVGSSAPIYLSAVLEYLCAEVLELSGNASRDNKKQRIIPRHISLAVRNDEELNKLIGNSCISQGGVLPIINEKLLPRIAGKKESVKKE